MKNTHERAIYALEFILLQFIFGIVQLYRSEFCHLNNLTQLYNQYLFSCLVLHFKNVVPNKKKGTYDFKFLKAYQLGAKRKEESKIQG